MLAYLRFFIWTGLLLMVLAAGAAGLLVYRHAEHAVKDAGHAANLAAARYFGIEIWAKDGASFISGQPPQDAKEHVQSFLQVMRLAGLRLYNKDGTLLFTSGGTLSSAELAGYIRTLNEMPLGMASEVETGPLEWGRAGLSQPARVHSVARLSVEGKEALAEFITDVSEPWSQLLALQWILPCAVVGLFLLTLLALYLVYQKGEIVIARQHERTMELEAAAATAQEETRQKSQFLAGISHELRTPLNAIIGFSDIIKTDLAGEVKNPQFQGYINDIHSSGVHLLSLINDILDLSKAEAGKLELEVEEVNATRLAVNCLRLVQPRAEAAGVELVNGMPKDHFVLETDGKKFKQILLNLLSNAVKFTPAGGKVKFTGWQDLAADVYLFQVVDTGIGIAQKDIAKAMTPFGQVDSALSRKYDGTGLGLPLTKKFVELMGGKFSIQSEINAGTTITFSLPRMFKAVDGVIVKKVS